MSDWQPQEYRKLEKILEELYKNITGFIICEIQRVVDDYEGNHEGILGIEST